MTDRAAPTLTAQAPNGPSSGATWRAFRSSPAAVVALTVATLLVAAAVFAGWLAPYDTRDLAGLELADARLPPAWIDGARRSHLLGTDDQGRDILSAMMFGARVSLSVGVAAVLLSLLIGVPLGLMAGMAGGRIDALLMRVCDVMLSFPSILVALLVDGVGRALFPGEHEDLALAVLVLAIALPGWVQYARTVRGSTLVEREKEYVQAARVIGVSPWRIAHRHVLPNVLGPVLVLATIHLATAILTEATLSFLGVGVPPTAPSLGTMIRVGNDFLMSGDWWIAVFPGLVLVMLSVSVNVLGDWLRDWLNPRLR